MTDSAFFGNHLLSDNFVPVVSPRFDFRKGDISTKILCWGALMLNHNLARVTLQQKRQGVFMFNINVKTKTLLLRKVNLAPADREIDCSNLLFLIVDLKLIGLIGHPYILMGESPSTEFVQEYTGKSQSCQISPENGYNYWWSVSFEVPIASCG